MKQYSPHQTVINYNAGGKQDRLLLGILLMALGETMIVMSGALIKHVTNELPVIQVMFFRSFFGLLLLLPLVVKVGLDRLKSNHLGVHLQRGVFGITAMYCLFYSFQTLKLTEAVLLKATSPIMLSLIAWLVLRERLSAASLVAVLLAFGGVAIIINPGQFDPVLGLGFIAGIVSALLAAFAKTMVRKLGRTESSDIIVFYFMIFGMVFTLPFTALNWTSVNSTQFAWLALIALFSTIGQLGVTKAYTVAKAGEVSMFTYLSMPIAALLGWIFWQEAITVPLGIGTTVIIIAGVLTVVGNRKTAKVPA